MARWSRERIGTTAKPRTRWLRLLTGGLLSVLVASCNWWGPGGARLGVPYRTQPLTPSDYCTAASVLMWRLWGGLPEISQSVIYNFEGGHGNTTIAQVAIAVRYFTPSTDAYWDQDVDSNYYQMISRQAASINNGVPVLPAVRFNHAGIIDGGSYHQDGAYYVWDFVYFNDPDPNVGGPDLYLGATDWIQNFCPAGQGFCDQVVAGSATAGWEQDLSNYGPQVRVSGGGRDGGPYVY